MTRIPKTIVEIPIESLKGIEERFGREMKMDPNQVPLKFKSYYEKTKQDSFEKLTVKAIYESFPVDQFFEEQIRLQNAHTLDSRMYVKMFQGAREIALYVVSVTGYEQLDQSEESMMGKLFLDSWGTSIVESASRWIHESIAEQVKRTGNYVTPSFSPGQHDVPMNVQTVIFQCLSPEQIGTTLNSHFLMQPKKSVSGAFGIGGRECDHQMRPCDFCSLRKTCPGSYKEFDSEVGKEA